MQSEFAHLLPQELGALDAEGKNPGNQKAEELYQAGMAAATLIRMTPSNTEPRTRKPKPARKSRW